jgi:uncharacterized membrane protein (DUF373 family)
MTDPTEAPEEPLFRLLTGIIRFTVRLLAILMTVVIVWSVVDVGWVLYNQFLTPPVGILSENDILGAFGAFLAALIAIEIFTNIVLYLRADVSHLGHVKLVMATALMAIARKVIVLDESKLEPLFVVGMAALIVALAFGYYLVSQAGEG